MRSVLGALLHATTLAWMSPTLANQATAEETAAALYDQASQAQLRGEYGLAAVLFAQADEAVPNPVALEAAVAAATLADDALLAMTLVRRADRAPPPSSLVSAVRLAQAKFALRVGEVQLACQRCEATLAGSPLMAGETKLLLVGRHPYELRVEGADLQRGFVDVKGQGRVSIGPKASAPPTIPEQPREREGIHPAPFIVTLSLTGATLGVAVGSWVDTFAVNSDYEDALAKKDKVAAASLASEGKSAETRSWVITGIGGALAITSGILAGLTDWSGSGMPTVTVDDEGVAVFGYLRQF